MYLPSMSLSLIQNGQAFALFLQGASFSVGKLFVPVQTDENCNTEPHYQFLASTLCGSKVEEVTFISQNRSVQEFRNKLQGELKTLSNQAPKLVVSGQQLDPCGPTYAPEEVQECTEKSLNPLKLVASLNSTTALSPHTAEKRGRTPQGPHNRRVSKASSSCYATDCTYSSEATKPTPDGPFTSEMWDLGKLHRRGVTGKGVTLAVIDSGINFMHPAFSGRVIAVKNFVSNNMDDVDCAIDSDGHGSLCAGIAAGLPSTVPITLMTRPRLAQPSPRGLLRKPVW